MPILEIHHATTYRYRRPVRFGEHRLMMRPRESYDQRVISAALTIGPEPADLRYVHDVFGNCVGIARFGAPADRLSFESRVVLEHDPRPLEDGGEAIGSHATFPFAYGADDMPDLMRSIERQQADPTGAVQQWARRFLRWNGPTQVMGLLEEMTRAIRADFTYAKRLHGGAQTPAQTLELGSGACRDFAVLMMDAVRSLGLAARYVSGYLHCPTREGAALHKGGGHTHAWVQVYLPSCGWVEFDPTNGIVGNRDLIKVAVVRDPCQASPLSGTWDGAADDYLGMDVEVAVWTRPLALPAVA